MSFISTAAHQKFILQCQSLINNTSADEPPDHKAARLQSDLNNLQKIAETYLKTMSQLPVLAREYNTLQRRIRINARRMQPVKNTGCGKK